MDLSRRLTGHDCSNEKYCQESVKHFRGNRICSLFIHFARQYRVSVISPFLRWQSLSIRFPRGNRGTIDPMVQPVSQQLYARRRRRRWERRREKERDFQLQRLSVPEFHSKHHCSRVSSCGQDFDPSTESNRFVGNFSQSFP